MNMSDSYGPRVFLVGAGPGSPGLLTVRAIEVLASADIVLFDQLVPKRLLDYANPSAEKICVRELPGNHPDKYPHIHTLLIESARQGKRIVRLKGGDPLIFGRGGEEAEALRAVGIPYEIVPGVTAAVAAGAYLDLPLTHRNYSSAVALVTGHELPNKPGNRLDWAALARFPGSLVIYMGVSRLPLIVDQLLKHGMNPDTPAAIVERVSTGEMRSITATLGTLDHSRRNAGLESPGLIIIGEAIDHRVEQSWYQSLPLFGQRILVTRPKGQSEEMIRTLEQLGAVPYVLPILEIQEVKDTHHLDQAWDEIRNDEWNWIVFSSANGVHFFMKRLEKMNRDVRDLGGVRIAAVGPKTAQALSEYHLRADLVPDANYSAKQLARIMADEARNQRVLLIKGLQGRSTLFDELSPLADVRELVVYEQQINPEPHDEILNALRRGEVRFLTLTSPNIARSVISLFDETIRERVRRGEIQIVAISPLTASAIQDLKVPVTGIAADANQDGIIDELIRLTKADRSA